MWFSKKKRRGDILISVIIAAAVGAVISISTVKMNLASINAATATKKITQAEQYAKAQAGLIRATKYDELAAVSKTAVGTDSEFSYEILKGEETAYNADVNQRIMTVNVYNGSDSVPLFTLNVPRLTKEENAGESYIVESWHEGTEWYRVWSDGFIEQGGITRICTYTNLKKAFSNSDYVITGNKLSSSVWSPKEGIVAFCVKTKTSFYAGTGVDTNRYINWQASGY